VGFEPTIPAFERAKTVHALDSAATVIGVNHNMASGNAPLANSYYHIKIKDKPIPTAICFLGLDQYNNSIINIALLYLVFANISDIKISISSSPVATLDEYHPPLLDFDLTLDCHHIC
jgi:hypothetical protein